MVSHYHFVRYWRNDRCLRGRFHGKQNRKVGVVLFYLNNSTYTILYSKCKLCAWQKFELHKVSVLLEYLVVLVALSVLL